MKSRGFTIVELLIVIVVIGILAAISLVAYNGITNRAKASAVQSAAQQAGKKVTTHALMNGEVLPATLATAGLSDSSDTTYQYTLNTAASPNNYCVTATSSGTSFHIAGTAGEVLKPVEGPCTGHAGTAPTVAASGEPCPSGFIVVPGSSLFGTDAFCVMKYEAKNAGSNVPVSQASGTPWVSIPQTSAIAHAPSTVGCTGCHLITEAEWLTIAHNVLSVPTNWSGGSVGSGVIYSGHNDNSPAQALEASTFETGNRRCENTVTVGATPACTATGAQIRTLDLTNGERIWDFAGNVWEWTSGTTEGGNQPGAAGYAWRNWNTLLDRGRLSVNPFPSYANQAASAWTSDQGIGTAYTDSTEGALRAFRRGSAWDSNTQAGVFALRSSSEPNATGPGIGFRVAR